MNKVDEIARIIEHAITSGEIPAGTVLRQDQLAEELGVSRTPVREALQQVAAQGLVTLEPNRGAHVRWPSRAELEEAYLIRAELEALAAELALARITRAHLKDLRASEREVARLTQALGAAGEREHRWLAPEWFSANVSFHDVILDVANAPLLKRTTQAVRTVVQGQIVWTPSAYLDELSRQAVTQHREIVEAFAERKPVVRDLVRQHVLDSLTFFQTILEHLTPQPRTILPAGLAGRPARS
jgi:DNA-binding GntR family transcriptional regulator